MGQLAEALKGIALPEETKALVAQADRLLAEWPKQAEYVQYLEAEIKRLQKEKGISGARDNLAFNQKTGTYIEIHSGIHHCPKCLSGEKRIPLKSEDYGWRCMVCGSYYDNPDRPPPFFSEKIEPNERI